MPQHCWSREPHTGQSRLALWPGTVSSLKLLISMIFKKCVHSFWLIWANLAVLWQVNDSETLSTSFHCLHLPHQHTQSFWEGMSPCASPSTVWPHLESTNEKSLSFRVFHRVAKGPAQPLLPKHFREGRILFVFQERCSLLICVCMWMCMHIFSIPICTHTAVKSCEMKITSRNWIEHSFYQEVAGLQIPWTEEPGGFYGLMGP